MHRIIRTQKQRIAWTNTSRIPDEQIVAAIKFVAREVNLDRVVVHFKKAGWRSSLGMAYGYIPSIANLDGLKRAEWRYLITVTDHYSGESRNAVIPMDAEIIDTLAHEGKHIEQYRERKMERREPRARAFGSWVADRWKEQAA